MREYQKGSRMNATLTGLLLAYAVGLVIFVLGIAVTWEDSVHDLTFPEGVVMCLFWPLAVIYFLVLGITRLIDRITE
jgi:hypothetical protein